ncbi:sigma-70 family RNA polymerase sigma factor [Polyangium sp. 15x6]|uniref:sigma-70 family RNA polymerase sigma factor n=1 Tax=Polyangium sp. 15x6 TaxID=3042687 RepID=UPI00249A9993|nr:sigma-70 family RNA polymerase sigma factor [Polyangium sp. 15x6]MDI3288744.1 sigma-70 family RNA polymerase sigma factor [Polyangium sp. 15x6]
MTAPACRLTEVFLQQQAREQGAARGEEHDALSGLLERAVASARAAWPEIDVPAEAFVRWLSERIAAANVETLERALGTLRLGDLYLACACARGDRAALAAFERSYVPDLIAAIQHVDRSGSHADDVLQVLRQKLFVGEPSTGPKIREYGGRGELRRWLRAVAVRGGIDALRAAREIPVEDELLDAIEVPADHPELLHLKRTSLAELKLALRDALGALSARERTLLQQYYLDGAHLEALAALYRVTPSAVSRSLAKTRATLMGRVRNALMARLRLSGREVDNILVLVQSQLELSRSMLDGPS